MYVTDRGIDELEARRGQDQVALSWLAEQPRTFVDLGPKLETAIGRFGAWAARLDNDED